jgi:hypothetical protein
MFFKSIIFLTTHLLCIQSSKPRLELTITPYEKYNVYSAHVEISCELKDAFYPIVVAQLWHVDLKTGNQTPITRSLLFSPSESASDVFKQNRYQNTDLTVASRRFGQI